LVANSAVKDTINIILVRSIVTKHQQKPPFFHDLKLMLLLTKVKDTDNTTYDMYKHNLVCEINVVTHRGKSNNLIFYIIYF
jgi:hypothetical protein